MTTPGSGSERRRTRRTHAVRACAGCRKEAPRTELVRVVLDDGARVAVDLGQSEFGRGAWLHPSPGCVAKAASRGLARSFRANVRTTPAELGALLRDAGHRRVEGLLSAAARARRVAAGTDAVHRAMAAGEAKVVVVATDAKAAATAKWIVDAAGRGEALGWGTKEALGRAALRKDTGVVAVLDDGIAVALRFAIAISQIPDSDALRESERKGDGA